MLPSRGEVWWCELPEIQRRPVVVLSRDATIPRLRRVIVAPCTTNIRGLPTEVLLEPDVDPTPARCVVGLDSTLNVSVGQLTERIGALSGVRMQAVCDALAVAVGCSRA